MHLSAGFYLFEKKITCAIRPKKKNSLSQLPARIAFKNPNLPHFFFFFFRFLRDFQFFHLFFPTNGKKG